MKKYLVLLLSVVLLLSLAAYGNSQEESTPPEPANNKESAAPGSNIEGNMETRVILTIGDAVIPATLNSTVTAQELTKRLPYTVTASKMQYDFCGTVEELPRDDSERQAGWKNGDIGFKDGWFALFHSGEDESASYTSEMIIGHIDDEYLETIRSMSGSITIMITLADEYSNLP
jgi:hypothetical protein